MPDSTRTLKIFFATNNIHKYNEVNAIFKQHTFFQLKFLKTPLVEIQSSNLEEIAIFSLKKCSRIIKNTPIFVEDSGLFIKHLNGFPGPYSAYIFKTIGLKGIIALMKEIEDREAYFQSSIALKIENKINIFTGQVRGQIAQDISDTGWGYDPIFIPESDGIHTFGELGIKKNFISHRFLATLKLIKFLNKYSAD
ncbi:MAG: RdgB/HAM1 family non-canonical purine NTP pyrophosphatase [Candidatus Heimdallarchaeota archaeon]|nr:MAG: RdgB/HAM1 family non-canonical purine NTP pyrophosphatase [Candidatus Heimdallarchaeota archaeon]